MSHAKKPKPTAGQMEIEKAQLVQLTALDDEENKRRKQLLSNAAGIRAYNGSALTRTRATNTSSGTAATAPSTGASAGTGAAASTGPSSGRASRFFGSRQSLQ